MPKTSAGLLPYRHLAIGPTEVLLVHPGGPFWQHKDAHAWSIAKGEHAPDEDSEQAARREFREELGLAVPDGPLLDLGTVRQAGGKVVQAWAVAGEALDVEHMVSNQFEIEWPPRSGSRQWFPEVDRAEWMTLPEARGRVVKGQVAFLDRLADALAGSG